jgi:hypothetical protein
VPLLIEEVVYNEEVLHPDYFVDDKFWKNSKAQLTTSEAGKEAVTKFGTLVALKEDKTVRDAAF